MSYVNKFLVNFENLYHHVHFKSAEYHDDNQNRKILLVVSYCLEEITPSLREENLSEL
jgi:hypothetical protein